VPLVPVNEASIKTAGAVTGGLIGLFLAGPWGALVLAAISNYVVKKVLPLVLPLAPPLPPPSPPPPPLTSPSPLAPPLSKDDESGEAVRGFGKTTLETFNFFTKVARPYRTPPPPNTATPLSLTSTAIVIITTTTTTSIIQFPQLNAKYEITDKVTGAVGKAVDSIDGDGESPGTIKSSVSDATEKLSKLDERYDFVGKAKELAAAAGNILIPY
jgi:hypothetical protein